jgi:hypothetical protein
MPPLKLAPPRPHPAMAKIFDQPPARQYQNTIHHMSTRIDSAVDAVRAEISNVIRRIDDGDDDDDEMPPPPGTVFGRSTSSFARNDELRIMHEMQYLDRTMNRIRGRGFGGAAFLESNDGGEAGGGRRRSIPNDRGRRRRGVHRRRSSSSSASSYVRALDGMKRLGERWALGLSRFARFIEMRSRHASVEVGRRYVAFAHAMVRTSMTTITTAGSEMMSSSSSSSSQERSSTSDSTDRPSPPPRVDDGFSSSWMRLSRGTADRACSNAMSFIRRRILDERRRRGGGITPPRRRKF